jgi:hypothetical protein
MQNPHNRKFLIKKTIIKKLIVIIVYRNKLSLYFYNHHFTVPSLKKMSIAFNNEKNLK